MYSHFGRLAVTLLILIASAAFSTGASISVTNGNTISIPAGTGTGNATGAPAAPYPSTVSLSGVSGRIVGVTARLRGFSHNWPTDVDVLLVGPNGTNIVLMSDAGGSNAVANVTLTFSAAAANSVAATTLTSGTYLPTNYSPPDSFPSPAPPQQSAGNFNPFYGGTPNGTWSLFVVDDNPGNTGAVVNGWDLTLDTTTLPVITTQPQSQTVLAGSTATLSVVAASDFALSYQWFFRNILVQGATGPSLTISNVQSAQSGDYFVRVTNVGDGSTNSAIATLNIYGPIVINEWMPINTGAV